MEHPTRRLWKALHDMSSERADWDIVTALYDIAIAISPRTRCRCSSWATAHATLLWAGIYMQNALIVVGVHLPATGQGYHELAQALSNIDEMLEVTTIKFGNPEIILTGDYKENLERRRDS